MKDIKKEMIEKSAEDFQKLNEDSKMFILGLTYHVFIAKYAERKSQLEEIYDLIERYQFPMLETVVRNRVSVNSANKARKPLARHRRFDAATKDYEDLTKEVLALME